MRSFGSSHVGRFDHRKCSRLSIRAVEDKIKKTVHDNWAPLLQVLKVLFDPRVISLEEGPAQVGDGILNDFLRLRLCGGRHGSAGDRRRSATKAEDKEEDECGSRHR